MLDNILVCGDFKCSISHAEGENAFYISLSKEGALLKIKISDYLSTADYLDTVKIIDKYCISSMISNNVLWNSRKQMVNKGSYYILKTNNILYNVYIDDFDVIFDSRIKEDDDTYERIIKYNLVDNKYSFCSFKNDINGSTSNIRYYASGSIKLIAHKIPREEAYKEINSMLTNLVGLNIDRLDIESIKDTILSDLNNSKSHFKTLIKKSI